MGPHAPRLRSVPAKPRAAPLDRASTLGPPRWPPYRPQTPRGRPGQSRGTPRYSAKRGARPAAMPRRDAGGCRRPWIGRRHLVQHEPPRGGRRRRARRHEERGPAHRRGRGSPTRRARTRRSPRPGLEERLEHDSPRGASSTRARHRRVDRHVRQRQHPHRRRRRQRTRLASDAPHREERKQHAGHDEQRVAEPRVAAAGDSRRTDEGQAMTRGRGPPSAPATAARRTRARRGRW